MHHEFSQTLKSLLQLHTQQIPFAMATVLRVHGSSYRREGARMLITENGQGYGQISGGCLEGDILKKAQQAIAQHKSLLITYDTRKNENQPLKVALGCNGIVDILIEPASPALLTWAKQIDTLFTQDKTGVSSLKVLWQGQQTTIEYGVNTQNTLQTQSLNEIESGLLLNELVPLRKQLLIWGAGPDVLPVVHMAQLLNWKIIVAYDEPNFMHHQNIKPIELRIDTAQTAFDLHNIHTETALLLASHSYPRDKAVLASLAHAPLRYVGIMGPKFRGAQLLNELEEQLGDAFQPLKKKCYFPTGLDIGSDNPAEIALSILAEIQAVFAGKSAGFLKNRNKPLHHRNSGEADYIAETTVNQACTIRIMQQD